MSELNKEMPFDVCVVMKPTLLYHTSEFDRSHCWC